MTFPIARTILKLIGCAVAALVTYFAVGLALSLGARESWLSTQYFRAFGLAPFIARVADPNWSEGEGLVLAVPWVGERVYSAVVIAFWTALFGALYFYFVFRRRPTI